MGVGTQEVERMSRTGVSIRRSTRTSVIPRGTPESTKVDRILDFSKAGWNSRNE